MHYKSAFLLKFCTTRVRFCQKWPDQRAIFALQRCNSREFRIAGAPKMARPAGNFCTAEVQFPRISHCGGAKNGSASGRFLRNYVKNWVFIRDKAE
jgi:hypothetical protein